MSELYCDRCDDVRTSSSIIREYFFHKQNHLFPNEISLMKTYCLYESAYLNLLVSKTRFGICPQGLSKEQVEELINDYKIKLKELENSLEMRNFLRRIEEKEFTMSYGENEK